MALPVNEYEYNLDLKFKTGGERLEFQQNSINTCKIRFRLTDEFEPINITGMTILADYEGDNGRFSATTSTLDEISLINIINATQGEFDLIIASSVLQQKGKIKLQIKLVGYSGVSVFPAISINVKEGVNNEEEIQATNDFPLVMGAINSANNLIRITQEIIEQENARIGRENIREANELMRAELTNHLENMLPTLEDAVVKEPIRQQNEINRINTFNTISTEYNTALEQGSLLGVGDLNKIPESNVVQAILNDRTRMGTIESNVSAKTSINDSAINSTQTWSSTKMNNTFRSQTTSITESDLDTSLKTKINHKTPNINAPSPFFIHTYDGGNQVCHTSLVTFTNAWNGHKYWMALTPYPDSNDAYENPCIYHSDNLISWTGIEGNPLATGNGSNQNLSDVALFYNSNTGALECWWRWIDKTTLDVRIYRRTSTNGTSWTPAQLLFSSTPSTYGEMLSPTIIYENGQYKMYVTSIDGIMSRFTSTNATTWTKEQDFYFSYEDSAFDNYRAWHQTIKKIGSTYYMIFSAYPKGQRTSNIQKLFYSQSTDGITWKPARFLLEANKNGWDNKMIYQASFDYVDGLFYVYYSAHWTDGTNRKWGLGLLSGSSLDSLYPHQYVQNIYLPINTSISGIEVSTTNLHKITKDYLGRVVVDFCVLTRKSDSSFVNNLVDGITLFTLPKQLTIEDTNKNVNVPIIAQSIQSTGTKRECLYGVLTNTRELKLYVNTYSSYYYASGQFSFYVNKLQ